MLLDLGLKIIEIHGAVVRGGHDQNLHSGHHGGCGVGAMRRGRDQANPAIVIAPSVVVAADGEQACQLSLAAGIGLNRHPGVPVISASQDSKVLIRMA